MLFLFFLFKLILVSNLKLSDFCSKSVISSSKRNRRIIVYGHSLRSAEPVASATRLIYPSPVRCTPKFRRLNLDALHYVLVIQSVSNVADFVVSKLLPLSEARPFLRGKNARRSRSIFSKFSTVSILVFFSGLRKSDWHLSNDPQGALRPSSARWRLVEREKGVRKAAAGDLGIQS